MNVKRWLIAIPLVVVALLLQSAFWVPRYETQTAGNPKRLTHFIEAGIGDPQILNPILSADSAASEIENLVFDTLLDVDEQLQPRGKLAEAWEITEEAYLAVLPGRALADGTPATPERVAAVVREAVARGELAGELRAVERLPAEERRTELSLVELDISLGLKQVEANPWLELTEKYPVGSTLTGKVRNLTEFGAFVEVDEGIDGLVHISDMSWSKRLKHPSEILKKGDTVTAMVLNIDAENQRLSLGLKQLQTDVWDEFFTHHHVGDVVEGKVVRLTNFGAFVELADGIEGLIHVSEFDDAQGQEKIELEVEKAYQMKIIQLIPSERKIGLSIRALKSDEYRSDWEAYSESSGRPEVTLGDHFKMNQ